LSRTLTKDGDEALLRKGMDMPRIGLLSDSHGRAVITQMAVKILLAQQAQLILHLGDVGTVEVIDALAGLVDDQNQPVPSRLVFGNTDWDTRSLTEYARDVEVGVNHPVGVIDLGPAGTRGDAAYQLIFTHGDDPGIMDNALSRQVKYLCHGHTHRMADHRQGATRVINPGALTRASQYTVALLDTDNDQLTFHPVMPS